MKAVEIKISLLWVVRSCSFVMDINFLEEPPAIIFKVLSDGAQPESRFLSNSGTHTELRAFTLQYIHDVAYKFYDNRRGKSLLEDPCSCSQESGGCLT
jgi:hypothetical protein